jgi:orotidine-5'-phosphate decarboxylase
LRDIGLEADIDGFVCSPYDINTLAAEDKIFVTPGIRTNNNTQDHHKVITPVNALQLGLELPRHWKKYHRKFRSNLKS